MLLPCESDASVEQWRHQQNCVWLQVVFADRILLNKTDLVPEDEDLKAIEKRLRDINPTALIERTCQSKIDPMKLLKIGAFDLKRVLDFDPEFLEDQEHEHDKSVTSCSTKFEGELSVHKLNRYIQSILQELGADL